MKLICDKENLNKSINIVIKAVNSKTTQPILKCIMLNASNSQFTLTANDLKLGIKSKNIESKIIENGSILLDAKLFSEIIRKLPDGEVVIETNSDNFVKITATKSEFKILGIESTEFPDLPVVEKNRPLILSSKILKDMISKTIFSVATEDIKPIFTGELLEIKENTLNMVAIDGFRVSHMFYKSDIDIDNISIVVPSRALFEVSKIINDDDTDICLYSTDKHLLFETEVATVVTRLLEGEFMEYEKIFTTEHTTKITTVRAELLESLERAIIVEYEGKRTPVKLSIEDGLMKITSNTEKGNSFDEIKVELYGEPLDIAFNPKYILDVLKNIPDEKITIEMTNSLSPGIIKGLSNSNYKFLILPLKLKG